MNLSVTSPTQPDPKAALWRAEKLHAGIITDTVNLEGNPFTLPEVQTLLDGVTVGGHKLSDEEQVLNQSESWKTLITTVKKKKFSLSKDTACALNDIVARKESLDWGVFRYSEVSISGTNWKPPKSDSLDQDFFQMQDDASKVTDPYIKSMSVFLNMARNKYFFSGNRRTGQLMMNGILLSSGYDAISVPYKRQLEFNEKMIRFYDTGDKVEIFEFLLSCSTTPYDKPILNK